ncbi:MAG: xanthine dehydrogenase family protein subunit M [Clostridia bacterium]|nr:xanthine dehydrogenase family protein subunit M [Clostridia bacterium]
MKPPPFEYHAPVSLEEAVELLAELGGDAKVLAGGQSLMPLLNLRLAQPAHLVDVNGLEELAQIRPLDGGLAVGALVRQRAAERSELVRERCPLLAEALPLIGHFQIRSRGTVGGSLAHADPAAELPAVAAALDADLVVRSARGERVLKPEDFFLTVMTTTLEPDELLVEVRFPAWPEGAGWSFQEVSRRHGDFALAGVAAVLQLGGDGTIADARLAFIGVGPTPVRARAAEQLLVGERPSPEVYAAAAEAAVADLEPESDLHATGAYRKHVARVLARRALTTAAERCRTGEEGGR